MPRNVRNFWIEVDVDGRKTVIKTGPRSKNGGMTIRLYQRHKGAIGKALLEVVSTCSNDILETVVDVFDDLSFLKRLNLLRTCR